MKEPQEVADELVEMYKQYSHRPDRLPENNRLTEETNNAIQCAILHTQGIIDALNIIANDYETKRTKISILEHQQVLTILKTRL